LSSAGQLAARSVLTAPAELFARSPEDHPDQRLEREEEELSLNFASWNQLDGWLRVVDSLRQ
jgi:hypothetical protein